MELTVLIPVMLIIFLAAVVMGVTSFGFALIAVPLLNLLLQQGSGAGADPVRGDH